MTGISPPFAKFTVLVTRRVLPGRTTLHAFVAKMVLSSRSDSSGWPPSTCHEEIGPIIRAESELVSPRLDDLAALKVVAYTPMTRVLLMADEPTTTNGGSAMRSMRLCWLVR